LYRYSTDLTKVGCHAATLTLGTPGTIHGFKCYVLQDENGEPAPVNTVASGGAARVECS
jgi:tryptophan synthase beta chain